MRYPAKIPPGKKFRGSIGSPQKIKYWNKEFDLVWLFIIINHPTAHPTPTMSQKKGRHPPEQRPKPPIQPSLKGEANSN
jgi:hypothetical protein